jgi:hypothetical protein
MSPLRYLLAASNGLASSASVSNDSCPRWMAPFSCSSWAQIARFQLSRSKIKLFYRSRSVDESVLVSGTHMEPATIFLSFFFRHLRVCWCRVPSLTRGLVCNLHVLLGLATAVNFEVPVPQNWLLYFTISNFRYPQSGGPCLRIYMPQEQGGQLPAIQTIHSLCSIGMSCTQHLL